MQIQIITRTQQSRLNLSMKIIVPYLEKEREKHNVTTNTKGLLIMNVFTGQMTSAVHKFLNKNNICPVNVPPKHDPFSIRFKQSMVTQKKFEE